MAFLLVVIVIDLRLAWVLGHMPEKMVCQNVRSRPPINPGPLRGFRVRG